MHSIVINGIDIDHCFSTNKRRERRKNQNNNWNLEQWIYEYSWRILQNKLWLYNWNRHFLTSLINSFITVFIILLLLQFLLFQFYFN